MFKACRGGYIDAVRLLLKVPGIDVNAVNNIGQTSLHWACYNGHTDVVKQLLKEPGINVNIIDNHSQSTPLHFACSHGHTDVVKQLLKVPEINVAIGDKHGSTPLYYASAIGHTDIVKQLLKMPEINVHITNNSGSTPLHLAFDHRHDDTVKELIKHMLFKNPNEEKPYCIQGNELFSVYWNECRAEVFSLKESMVNQKSLYDFCTMENKSKLENMSRNEQLQAIITEESFITTHTFFGNEIEKRLNEGLDRSSVTEQLLENLSLHDNVFSAEKNSPANIGARSKIRRLIRKKPPIEKIQLNEDIKREVFTYLDDSDLKLLDTVVSAQSNLSSKSNKAKSSSDSSHTSDERWRAQGAKPKKPR